VRRASGVFNRGKSDRGIEKEKSGRNINSPVNSTRNLSSPGTSNRNLISSSNGSSRNFSAENSSRNLPTEPVDEEQKAIPAFRQLPAAGFNRLKTMWANRESMTGFSSPLSTWSRPYGNHGKKDGNVHVTFDAKSKTYSGKVAKETERFKQFGCSIQDCPRTKVPKYTSEIPSVLLLLRDELEKQNGFLVEGVFRVAASFDDQKAYKLEVDSGAFKGCRTQDDAMCMAALLKEWFRTMPVRLLNALPLTSIQTGKSDIEKELPEPNLSVFMWLCDLMADVVSLEQVNRMNVRAMAIVIAPNLYSAGDDAAPHEIMQEMNGAVSIVEAALKDCLEKRKAEQGEASSGAA
jgi:hypothetical protein